jgi:hypothetical protein
LSVKWSSISESQSPTRRKFSSSPKLEQKARSVTVSTEQTTSRRSSRIGVFSPKSVKSSSSLSKFGSKGTPMNPEGYGGVGSSPGSIVQNSTSTCLRMSSGSSAGKSK